MTNYRKPDSLEAPVLLNPNMGQDARECFPHSSFPFWSCRSLKFSIPRMTVAGTSAERSNWATVTTIVCSTAFSIVDQFTS